ncbi:apoptosis-inducing factor 3-like isoform X2 [Homarus americanus]|uniref:apoptosis-inducing factor 3-like isoform X2 n=1 Tax=Homarus americanus TaxID=6706 RepID=UPI001C47407A|nr:apoptosis-inducing factor 3-like isoform X2 [Homarus americanus]
MAVAFFTRALRVLGVSAAAQGRTINRWNNISSQRILIRRLSFGVSSKCLWPERMGVTASCRNGGGAGDSDHGGEVQQGQQERRMSRKSSVGGDMMEAVICKEEDLPQDGMKTFEVEGGKVLVVHHKGQLSALGSKCSHYGAPLETGVLCNGRVRCPWHGACFSLATGDIEDFPGLDSIPKYGIEVVDGEVKITASKTLLAADKRVKTLARRDPDNPSNFVVIGGGAAGASCVETLRQEGYSGRLVMITPEYHLPYDRPKLSKAMDLTPDKISLRSSEFYESCDIEILQGISAERVDTEGKMVHLSSGEELPYDKIFIATGGKPRRLGISGDDLPEVYVIRTPEDSNAISAAASGKHAVIVGTSFIGMEAAAYLATNERAASVTIIGYTSVPFQRSLGLEVGGRIQALFEEQGVKFINGAKVTEFTSEEGRLTGVVLDTGETIPADVVVTGVGVVPNTEFLKSSDISLNGAAYVTVNEFLETSVPDVFCGGDIAAFPLFIVDGASVAIGHWQVALGHGRTAALNMLDRESEVKSVPFFWTVLFGKSLRYTGHGEYDDVIIGGDLENLSFIAYYCRGDRVVALASLGKDPAAAKYAEMLQQGTFLTKEQVVNDGNIALKMTC